MNYIKLYLAPFLLAAYVLSGSVPSSSAGSSIQHPMRFSLHYGDYSSGSEYYILAQGLIEEDTPDAFLLFIDEVKGRPGVYFNSPGGNLKAGLRLGRIIRDLCLDTHVGGPYITTTEPLPNWKVLAEKGICFSAAAYAFLGGNARSIGGKGLFGVHRFYGLTGKNQTVDAQVTMTLLSTYLDEMGVDRQLLDVASFITSEEVFILPLDTAKSLNVDNTDPPKSKWQIDVTKEGGLFVYVSQKVPIKNAFLTISISRRDKVLVALVTYKIQQCFRTEKNMERYFRKANKITLSSGGVFVEPAITAGWDKIDQWTFVIELTLTKDQLSTLLKNREMTFDARFPNALSDIDPSVTLSTFGLKPAFLAIMNQKGK